MDEVGDSESVAESEDLGDYRSLLPTRVPSLDLGRLSQRVEDLPLHHQPKLERPPEQSLYRGPAGPHTPAKTHVCKAHKLRLARLSRLDGGTKAKVSRSVQTASVKSWLHTHGYVVKADKLHPAVTRVIAEWFSLVDDDNSKTLEHHELLAALKAARVPCDDATIKEMISLMDLNKDGVIDWDEFEVFMTEEFAAGKSLLSGEYILPSGLSLNFGVMISKLKRNKLLSDIKDTRRRHKWANIASNPEALVRELATMQEAAEATSLTLEHLTRSEGDGLGIVTPRTQLTAALLRAASDARRSPTRAEEPGRSLKEKLRATARGVDVMQQSLFYEDPSPFASAARAFPDPTAAPLAAHQQQQQQQQQTPQQPADGSFYTTGVPDPLAHHQHQHHQPQLLETYLSEGFPDFPNLNLLAASQGLSHSATPGVGMRGPAADSGGTGVISPAFAAVPTRLAMSQLSSYDASGRPPHTHALVLPQRPADPSSDPVPSILRRSFRRGPGTGPGKGTGSWGAGASALYSEVANDLTCSWPSGAAASSSKPYQHMRRTDQSCCSIGSRSSSPTSAPLGGLSAHSAPRSPPRGPRVSGTSSGSGPAAASARSRHGVGMAAVPPHEPGEPHYAIAKTVASKQHQCPVSRTISKVGIMAKELRAAAGRLPLEPSPSGLPVTALVGVSRSSNGYSAGSGVPAGAQGGAVSVGLASTGESPGPASPLVPPLRLPSARALGALLPRSGATAAAAGVEAGAGGVISGLARRPRSSVSISAPNGYAKRARPTQPDLDPDRVNSSKLPDSSSSTTEPSGGTSQLRLIPQALAAASSNLPSSAGASTDGSNAPVALPARPAVTAEPKAFASDKGHFLEVPSALRPSAGYAGVSDPKEFRHIHNTVRAQQAGRPLAQPQNQGGTPSEGHTSRKTLRSGGGLAGDAAGRALLSGASTSRSGHSLGSPLPAVAAWSANPHRPDTAALVGSAAAAATPFSSTFQRVPLSTRSLLVSPTNRPQRESGSLTGLSANLDSPGPPLKASAAPAAQESETGASIIGSGSGSGSCNSRRHSSSAPSSAGYPGGRREGDSIATGGSRPSSRPSGAQKASLAALPHSGRGALRSRGSQALGGEGKEDLSWSAAAASMLQMRLSQQLSEQDGSPS